MPANHKVGVFNRSLAIDAAPCFEQDVDPLVRAHQAEHEDHGVVALQRVPCACVRARAQGTLLRKYIPHRPGLRRTHLSSRPARPRGLILPSGGQVREHPVRDHVHTPAVNAQLVHQARASLLRVNDDRVETIVQAPLGFQLTWARLAWEHIVGGDDQGPAASVRRPSGWKQIAVEVLNRKPLEVHDIRLACGKSVAQHVRCVLRQLARDPQPAGWGAEGGTVEELVADVPLGSCHRPVGEATGEQIHLRVKRRQRTAQRMVVGWRVSGGVDDVNAHQGKTIGRRAHRRLTLAATFAWAAFSYWLTVFPRVCLHIARWQRLARRIPDPVLRQLALDALEKRGNIEGAAAFAAFVPLARRANVTKATSAFQAAYNLLDMLGEQPSADPVRDGERLHERIC